MRNAYIKTLLLLFVVVFAFVYCVPNALSWGGLKGKIQKELDGTPFLKEEGIKLKVINEENGYVTIEMFEGNREIREKIDKGLDIFSTQFEQNWLLEGASQKEVKGLNVLRKALNYVKKMDGVKDVLLTAAVNTATDRADTYFKQGFNWYRKGKYDSAIADLNKALAVFPQHAKAYFIRGQIFDKKGEYERAIADYTKALEIDPKNGSFYNNYAWFLATCPDSKYRNGSKAVALAQKALEFDPQKPNNLDTLAAAYAETGNFKMAIETEKKALSLQNKDGYQKMLDVYKLGKTYVEYKYK